MKNEYYFSYCGNCKDKTIHYGREERCIRCESWEKKEKRRAKMLVMSNKNLKFGVKVDDDNVFPFTIEFRGEDFVMSKFYSREDMEGISEEIEAAIKKHDGVVVND